MIDRHFDAIQQRDIEELMQNSVPEGRTLEYKSTLPGGSGPEKKEFAADISSFANASGGDLLFGVEEAQGVPVAIPRLSKFIARETPVPIINEAAYVVVHLLPLSAFADTVDVDTTSVSKESLPPVCKGEWRVFSERLNIDGKVTFCQVRGGLAAGYTQLFRNGAIEVANYIVSTNVGSGSQKAISPTYESEIVAVFGKYLETLNTLGVTPPVFVLTSLCGVKGCRMWVPPMNSESEYAIDQDVLLLPEVTVDDYAGNPATLLKPVFDAAWNAVNYVGSVNYTSDVWLPLRQ